MTTKKARFGILVVTVAAICCLAGCSSHPFEKDENYATVALTTSSGQSYVWRSVNGDGLNSSGKDLALSHKSVLTLKKGEEAKVSFHCEACGNEQQYEVAEPWAAILECDCPEQKDESGNVREYSAIQISFEK